MFKKHYIGILIVVISFFGIASQNQSEVPNQEIIVQFMDANVAVEEIENIVTSIKIQLKELGVNDVNVSETGLGKLKITYYSDSDISSIKNKLTNKDILKLDLNKNEDDSSHKIPSNEDSLSYNLDVFEIQDTHSNFGINGINVSTIDIKSDHFYYSNTHLLSNAFVLENTNIVSERTLKVLEKVELSTNNIPHSIPDVRAGPNS